MYPQQYFGGGGLSGSATPTALADSVYVAGWQAVDRMLALPGHDALLAANTSLYSGFWNLSNHLQIARGDAMVGGTAVAEATRAGIVNADGSLNTSVRNSIAGWTAAVEAAITVAGDGTVTTTGDDGIGPLVVNEDGTITHGPGTSGTPVNPTHAEPNFLDGIMDSVSSMLGGVDKKWIYIGGAAIALFLLSGAGGSKR